MATKTSGDTYDVIVVGAGFAGLTAARELSWLGRSVAILEGRQRLGGRTWLDERLGRSLELGGGWVHWRQQAVWAELNRYRLALEPSPTPDLVAWIASSDCRTGSSAEFEDWLGDAAASVVADAVSVFPRPFDAPTQTAEAIALDQLSAADRLTSINAASAGNPDERSTLVRSLWSGHLNAPVEAGGLTEILRIAARADGSLPLLDEVSGGYRISGGTRALAEAIAADATADVVLGSRVAGIHQDNGRVLVTASSGSYSGRACIVTVPRNALGGIEFRPDLSPPKRRAVGSVASQGLKLWAAVQGEWPPFLALAPDSYPLNNVASEFHDDGVTYVVGFGTDSSAIDPEDTGAVQRALRNWFPTMRVTGSSGHDWVADEFSRETWPTLRPGHLADLPALQQPDGAVFLAGSDYATGWAGYIDGAIESGITAARSAHAAL
jgi:monoamine oxidase